MHIKLQELIAQKIPAFDGRAFENNLLVLEVIAINGPLLKYGINKQVGGRYSTVSRRVDDLIDRGYLLEAGERATERGKQSQETLYGLTWRGFIASLISKQVRENIIQVLNINPHLELPEKNLVLAVLGEVFLPENLEVISREIISSFLRTEGPNIEQIDENVLPYVVLNSLKHSELEPIKLSKIKDVLSLLDSPTILQYIKDLIVHWRKQLQDYYILLKIFDKVGLFILSLDARDKPSEKVREYLDSDFKEILAEIEDEKGGGDGIE